MDPESRDKVDVTWTVDAAAEFVKQHLKGVESEPSIVQSCIYTMYASIFYTINGPFPN